MERRRLEGSLDGSYRRHVPPIPVGEWFANLPGGVVRQRMGSIQVFPLCRRFAWMQLLHHVVIQAVQRYSDLPACSKSRTLDNSRRWLRVEESGLYLIVVRENWFLMGEPID